MNVTCKCGKLFSIIEENCGHVVECPECGIDIAVIPFISYQRLRTCLYFCLILFLIGEIIFGLI